MSSSDLCAEEAKHHESNGSPQSVANHHKDLGATLSMKRSWSADSLTNGGVVKTCVCAPTTHAGSFRCRLHRMPSVVGHVAHVAHESGAPPLPPPVAPPRNSASSTSIEAQ